MKLGDVEAPAVLEVLRGELFQTVHGQAAKVFCRFARGTLPGKLESHWMVVPTR